VIIGGVLHTDWKTQLVAASLLDAGLEVDGVSLRGHCDSDNDTVWLSKRVPLYSRSCRITAILSTGTRAHRLAGMDGWQNTVREGIEGERKEKRTDSKTPSMRITDETSDDYL
jgi:hypothetical protein